jgi:hypothetical protein
MHIDYLIDSHQVIREYPNPNPNFRHPYFQVLIFLSKFRVAILNTLNF